MKIIDISVPVSDSLPVYEGDPPVHISRTADISRGDRMTLSRLTMSAHTGTHVDAPLHFIADGCTVEQLDLDVLIGPARVVELPDVEREITARDLEAAQIPAGTERLLFKTRNSAFWAESGFRRDFIALGPGGAHWLVDHKIRLTAIDYLSIEIFGVPDFPAHKILLAAGVIALEGVDLRAVAPGPYQLVCLPVKLEGAEGAPARAVLIQE
jgi:arylformamidase